MSVFQIPLDCLPHDTLNPYREVSSIKIVLTGAAGFIGSNLAARLIDDGHEVIGVDNFLTGQRDNLAYLRTLSRFTFIEHDVIEPLPIAGDLDWIMHFASPASPPRYLRHPVETLRVNSEGTRHLLELARDKGAQFFLASTSEVYGNPDVHPQPESYCGYVNPIGARSCYNEAKRYAEALTTTMSRQYGIPIRIIRIFNTFGPRMDLEDGRVITNFIHQIQSGQPLTVYGDGSQTRSFQYIDDLLEGIVRLMDVPYGQPVNLGNPEEYSILEIARLTRELMGSQAPIEYRPLPEDDPRRRKPDIARARQLLGWEPSVRLREALMHTIRHYQGQLIHGMGDL